MNTAKFIRTSVLQNTSGRLLLNQYLENLNEQDETVDVACHTLIPLNFIVLVKMCRIGIKSDFRKLRLPKPSVFLLFRTNYLVGYFYPNLPQMFQQRFPHRHLIWLLGQKGRTIQPDGHGNTRSNGKEGKLLFTWATSLYLAMHIYKYYLHLK